MLDFEDGDCCHLSEFGKIHFCRYRLIANHVIKLPVEFDVDWLIGSKVLTIYSKSLLSWKIPIPGQFPHFWGTVTQNSSFCERIEKAPPAPKRFV